jgi:hypothetical protein
MMDEDRRTFRRLMGGKEEDEETPKEVEAREERARRGEHTVFDALKMLPAILERDRKHYLDLYGLNDSNSEEEKLQSNAAFEMMSEEQAEQNRRAYRAYRKRDFPLRDKDDRFNNLWSFAATNPPEVLRKHIWRLQRGLDEPLFGTEPEPPLGLVKEYTAAVSVALCGRCAEELRRETEASGAERYQRSSKRLKDYFYDLDNPASAHFYLFRYEEMYVERERGTPFSFPHEEPKECARCGVDDVSLWKERFGSE